MEHIDMCTAADRLPPAPLALDAICHTKGGTNCGITRSTPQNRWVLVLLLHGRGQLEQPGKQLLLGPGQLLLFWADAPFTWRCTQDDCAFWWLEFRCQMQALPPLPQALTQTLPLTSDAAILALCQASLDSLQEDCPAAAASLTYALLWLLARALRQPSTSPGKAALFGRAESYLRQNLATATARSTAQALHVSNGTLLQLIHMVKGMSTVRYIHSLKMEEAGRLLDEGLTVRETAERLGYADQCIFSKAFRRYYGTTPRSRKRPRGWRQGAAALTQPPEEN